MTSSVVGSVTVIQAGPCPVAQVKSAADHGYDRSASYWTGPGRGWLAELDLPPASREIVTDCLAVIDALAVLTDRIDGVLVVGVVVVAVAHLLAAAAALQAFVDLAVAVVVDAVADLVRGGVGLDADDGAAVARGAARGDDLERRHLRNGAGVRSLVAAHARAPAARAPA